MIFIVYLHGRVDDGWRWQHGSNVRRRVRRKSPRDWFGRLSSWVVVPRNRVWLANTVHMHCAHTTHTHTPKTPVVAARGICCRLQTFLERQRRQKLCMAHTHRETNKCIQITARAHCWCTKLPIFTVCANIIGQYRWKWPFHHHHVHVMPACYITLTWFELWSPLDNNSCWRCKRMIIKIKWVNLPVKVLQVYEFLCLFLLLALNVAAAQLRNCCCCCCCCIPNVGLNVLVEHRCCCGASSFVHANNITTTIIILLCVIFYFTLLYYATISQCLMIDTILLFS